MPQASDSQAYLARFLELHPKYIDLSLERMWQLLDQLSNPETKLPPVIHIAGTNGKGSTLAYLKAMMQAQGLRVHAYTSPHLVHFHERIELDGQPISETELAAILAEVEEKNAGAPITFFEATTATAFCAFAQYEADYLLLEVGLGGRLDATNVIAAPRQTLITPISMDHEQFLGTQLEQIAAEKAGILKANCLALSAAQNPAAQRVLQQTAKQISAPLHISGEDWSYHIGDDGLVFAHDGLEKTYPLPALIGAHQYENAALAIKAALDLGLSDKAIAAGLATARWPARLQKLPPLPGYPDHQNCWLDGGHNPAAAQALSQWLKTQGTENTQISLICGMLNTKQADDYFAAFKGLPLNIATLKIENEPNSLSAEALCDVAQKAGLAAKAYPDFDACMHAMPPHGLVLICGSLYLAGQVLARINQPD